MIAADGSPCCVLLRRLDVFLQDLINDLASDL